MNVLYIDIDSLRPDHLGCYGYHRETSPNIDAIAREGLRFDNCYVPDAPCLPSRTAITTGRFGIHTGVTNHGGVASQPHIWGPERGFRCEMTHANWVNQFREKGYHTVAFSPFAQRHGAWHWYAGFMEMHNTGGNGQETADAISPQVKNWLENRNAGSEENFFMWINVWDPHTPYRTPMDYGNPFADEPIPSWYTEEVRQAHWTKPGPHSAQEVCDYEPKPKWLYANYSPEDPAMLRQPTAIESMKEARRMFDGYDTGVSYADYHVGQIIQSLKDQGLYENTAIIISSDHGENLGELWVYGDHQTADHITNRVPLIARWPGVTDDRAGQCDSRLLYTLDFAATSLELSDMEVPEIWDGASFANTLDDDAPEHHDALVLSQMAWCVQRSARWGDFLLIHTHHDAQRDYPEFMLFNLKDDPNEQNNLSETHPELVEKGKQIIERWKQDMLAKATHPGDPLDTVMSEGGSHHAITSKTEFEVYIRRLRETGRYKAASRLEEKNYVLH